MTPIRSTMTVSGRYRVMAIDISKLILEAVRECSVSKKEGLRAKNLWTLGLIYWMYDRDIAATVDWLGTKFKNAPNIAAANIACLKAGHAFGETAELPDGALVYEIKPATFPPGALPHRHRDRGAGLGPGGGHQARRAQAGVQLLPDHAGLQRAARAVPAQGPTTW